MCILLCCLLLCKPDCCRESFNAVHGTVYLGHGWFVPPHWNASKGLWKGVWYFVFSLSDFFSKTVLDTLGDNSISCVAFRNTGVTQGLKTHHISKSQFIVSTNCILGHEWCYYYSSLKYIYSICIYRYACMWIGKHNGSLAERKGCLFHLNVHHKKVKERKRCLPNKKIELHTEALTEPHRFHR